MKKYLEEYVKYIDNVLDNDKGKELNKIISEHLIKIGFFQHERLIHLLVTLFYVLFTLAMFAFINLNVLFVIPSLLLLLILLFYVKHYFFLENNVQYLYQQYDLLKEKSGGK